MEKALIQKQRRNYIRIYLTLIHIFCVKSFLKFINFISAIYTLNHVQVRTYTYRYDHTLQVPWQTPPQVLRGILLESNGEHLLMLATKYQNDQFQMLIAYSNFFDMLKCTWNLLAIDTF